ncbi:hypothetical protein GH877_30330, partial [Bacillus thuringiensis]|nr:hypothetical protein [Bacillus thuringiensis]
RMNLKKIEMHNYLHSVGLKSYTLGVNEYADMEHKEFVKIMNGLLQINRTTRVSDRLTYLTPLNVKLDLPKKVDWREKGYVTPVKN